MPKHTKRAFLTFVSAASLAAPLLTAGLSLPAATDDGDHDRDQPRRDGSPSPKVVLISLDGAKPDLIQEYLDRGVLPRNGGLAKVSRGVIARQNVTTAPSLTAVAHVTIATGSTAVNNDIPANTFHAVAAPINTSISGFAAPIGGYQAHPLGPHSHPTAEPLWVRLRQAGRKVV